MIKALPFLNRFFVKSKSDQTRELSYLTDIKLLLQYRGNTGKGCRQTCHFPPNLSKMTCRHASRRIFEQKRSPQISRLFLGLACHWHAIARTFRTFERKRKPGINQWLRKAPGLRTPGRRSPGGQRSSQLALRHAELGTRAASGAGRGRSTVAGAGGAAGPGRAVIAASL